MEVFIMSVKALYTTQIYDDFILAKRSILVTEGTIRFYSFTLLKFLKWLEDEGVTDPKEIHARHVRGFLSILTADGKSDSYVHGNARAIKTFIRFLYNDGYIDKEVKFDMPPVRIKVLPVLNENELNIAISHCKSLRDKVIVLFLVDTGLRRAECCSLTWGNINLKTGVIGLERGKGHKPRSVVIGKETRKLLTNYMNQINPQDDNTPLFLVKSGKGITPMGLRSMLLRLSKKCGLHITPHSLRRTFATLALRAGMNPLHLQALLGHATLEMTRRYIQMVDDDLIKAHNAYSPIDKFTSHRQF
jgi:integrase/recombinase XerD